MPPPFTVPRLMVTHSRMVLSSPICVSVGSPVYFKSCGATPIGAEGIDGVARADAGAAVEHDMRDQDALLTQHDLRANGRKRADGAGGGNDRSLCDDRAGMNAHSAAAVAGTELLSVSAVDADSDVGSRRLGTTWQVSVASQAILPSTRRHGLNASHARAEDEHIHLNPQLVAWRNRPAKLGLLNAGEDNQLS